MFGQVPPGHLLRFYNPIKIISGAKALEHLPVEMGCRDAVRPMVVTQRESGFRGRLRRLVNALRDSGMTLVVYDRLSPETTLDNIRALAGHFCDAGCDALLALGRGSLLHQAKALRLFAGQMAARQNQEADSNRTAAADSRQLPDPETMEGNTQLPLFWLPTAPGAGDELSGLIDYADQSVRHVSLRPQVACVDERLLNPGNRDRLLDNVLITFVNGIEVCLNCGDNPFAATYAEAAVKAIIGTLTPEGLEAPASRRLLVLTNAAVWADCARDMHPPGFAHRLGKTLSTHVGLGAGICMALCLPATVDLRLAGEPRLAAEMLHLLGDAELYSLTTLDLRRPRCVNLLREGWQALQENWPSPIPAGLQNTGLDHDTLAAVAQSAVPEDSRRAQEILEQSWSLVAPHRLQALSTGEANPTADGDSTAPRLNVARGAQDGPAELL
ncbi:MAG: iron-containing alcohol dehydrogenase [Desulfosarcinaceae bacterium]|nr:iron-containing alcohol dehydrogenase [Desulfosarcinaceae bacterium]